MLYLLRVYSPSTQFVNDIVNIPHYGPMGPSSRMFRFFVQSPLFRYSPHTGQCSHTASDQNNILNNLTPIITQYLIFILPENNTFDKMAKTKRTYHALPMCECWPVWGE
jgi:hypothetical protein